MKFMVSASFRSQDRSAILALIPQEQSHIKDLKEQKRVETLYVSSDLSQVWIVIQTESRDQLQETLESLPLYPYMQVEIAALSDM